MSRPEIDPPARPASQGQPSREQGLIPPVRPSVSEIIRPIREVTERVQEPVFIEWPARQSREPETGPIRVPVPIPIAIPPQERIIEYERHATRESRPRREERAAPPVISPVADAPVARQVVPTPKETARPVTQKETAPEQPPTQVERPVAPPPATTYKKPVKRATGKAGRKNTELQHAVNWILWEQTGFDKKRCPWKNPYECKKHCPPDENLLEARRLLGFDF